MAGEKNVLVTGFGANLNAPYGNSTSNPAGLVAGRLPPSLPADHALNPSKHAINILDSVAGKFDSIPGEMGIVRNRIRELHAEHGAKVDLWIHLGRGPWDFVSCERLAFRQDFTSSWLTDSAHKAYYLNKDNVGQTVHELEPCPWASQNVPMGLNTELDVETIAPAANAALEERYRASTGGAVASPPIKVRSHLEAGDLGCGFAFYESLANCFVAGRKRHVFFVHVPKEVDDANVERARDAVLAIIGASISSLLSREDTANSAIDWKQEFGRFT